MTTRGWAEHRLRVCDLPWSSRVLTILWVTKPVWQKNWKIWEIWQRSGGSPEKMERNSAGNCPGKCCERKLLLQLGGDAKMRWRKTSSFHASSLNYTSSVRVRLSLSVADPHGDVRGVSVSDKCCWIVNYLCVVCVAVAYSYRVVTLRSFMCALAVTSNVCALLTLVS